MVDYALQRRNMVESQVRPSDVTDRRIIRAMLDVPREAFAPSQFRATAYMDEHLPVSTGPAGRPGRHILAARVLARMIQALEPGERDLVLDIGGATGYSAALLAKIAQTVVAVECDQDLVAEAGRCLAALGIDNVVTVAGALPDGYAAEGPYDGILVNGAVAEMPDHLLDQLKDGGRLVAVMIDRGVGKVMQWRRLGGTFDHRPIMEAGVPALPGFEPKPVFVL